MTDGMDFSQVGPRLAALRPERPKIDPRRLRRHLAEKLGPDGSWELGELQYVEGAGASNGIVIFDVVGRDSKRSFVLRYVPGEQLIKQKRLEDEFYTLKAVNKAGIEAPVAYWCEPSGAAIGYPFLVMGKLPGRAPSPRLMFSQGLLAEVSPPQRRKMLLDAFAFHGRLRRAAIGPDAVPHLATRGAGSTPIEREANWWLTEARLSGKPDDPRVAYLARAVAWMIEHQPDVREATLVHGDSQPANLLFEDGELVGALDWELSYLGHNEVDLAVATTVIFGQVPPGQTIDLLPTESELISSYERAAGGGVQHWEFFRLFALVRVGAIMIMTARNMPDHVGAAMWDATADAREAAWQAARRAAAVRSR